MTNRTSYWDFICNYLPDYSIREDVTLSDRLYKIANNEPLTEEDEAYFAIKYDNDIRHLIQDLIDLDTKLFAEALTAYYSRPCMVGTRFCL